MFELFNKRKKVLSKILGVLFLSLLFFVQAGSVFAATEAEKQAALTKYNEAYRAWEEARNARKPRAEVLRLDNLALEAKEEARRVGAVAPATPGANPWDEEAEKNAKKWASENATTGGKVDFDCDWLEPLSVCSFSEFLYTTIVKMSSWFMATSGQLFNSIIVYTIINAKDNMFPEGPENGYINETWSIFRDIVNIALIFVIVYIGIMTIIKGTEFGTKRMLATVVAVALFLNFSMFFTKLFIDFGNVAAVNINTVLSSSVGNNNPDKTVASYILSALGLNDLVGAGLTRMGSNSPVAGMINKEDWGGLLLYGFFASAIMVVTGLVLLIASLMFFVRYIMLIFLLIFSSAAFGSHILPSLRSNGWDKWFKALIGQVFLAPAFLLMLVVSSYVINAVATGFAGSSKKVTGWFDLFGAESPKISDAILNQVIPFMVVMAFLIGSIILSKKLSDMGGGYAGTLTKSIGGMGLGLTTWGSRKLIGGTSSRLLNSTTMKNWADSDKKGLGGAFARAAGGAGLALGAKASKATWDPRNAIGVASLLKRTGINMGDASKKSIESDRKDAAKLKEERAGRRKFTDAQEAAEEAKIEAQMRKEKIEEMRNKGELNEEIEELTKLGTETLIKQIKQEKENLEEVNTKIEESKLKIEELKKTQASSKDPDEINASSKLIKELEDGIQKGILKRDFHQKEMDDRNHAREITSSADEKIKAFQNRQESVKKNYYARLAGVDPQTGGDAAGAMAWIRREVIERAKPASNGQARALYKKEKKGKTPTAKLAKDLADIMKKEGVSTEEKEEGDKNKKPGA